MCDNLMCRLDDCEIPYGYYHCGCGGKTNICNHTISKQGAKKGFPLLYIKYHHLKSIFKEYIIDEETGCWEWQRCKNKDGYGNAYFNNKLIGAHKKYYEEKYGPVPEGMELDHFVCQNPGCCNPDHVQPVSHKENTRRGVSAKLTLEQVKEIREKYFSKECTPKELSLLYGVSRNHIYNIKDNRVWVEEVFNETE